MNLKGNPLCLSVDIVHLALCCPEPAPRIRKLRAEQPRSHRDVAGIRDRLASSGMGALSAWASFTRQHCGRSRNRAGLHRRRKRRWRAMDRAGACPRRNSLAAGNDDSESANNTRAGISPLLRASQQRIDLRMAHQANHIVDQSYLGFPSGSKEMFDEECTADQEETETARQPTRSQRQSHCACKPRLRSLF